MKKLILLFICIPLTFLMTSCSNCEKGEGEETEFTLALPQIKGIVIKGNVDVEVKQSNNQKVSITTHQNIYNLLNQSVEDGIWVIEFKQCLSETQKIYLEATALTSIEVEGSGDCTGANNINTDSMLLSIKGSGDIDITLNSRKTTSVIKGSGNISLKGSSTQHLINVAGSGDIDARDFTTVDSEVTIKGSGNADVNTTGNLNVSISGSGDVTYKGEPAKFNSDIQGSGQVRKM